MSYHAGIVLVERAVWRELRAKTQELQAKVVKLQQEFPGVFALGEVDREGPGPDVKWPNPREAMQMATQAEKPMAQSNRILKGAINDVVKSGNARADFRVGWKR